ncbi:MAG: nucleotide disphospho-sugar-binding domain-containing protein, partial [Telluria sp.]
MPDLSSPAPCGRRKILFVAEAVTLAHVGRVITLAQGLDPQHFDVHVACADGYDFAFQGCGFTRWPIKSIPSQQFLDALAEGKPVYDEATLARYVDDDLALLAQVRPDVVVGDFRLSLSVSARLAKLPYVSLINAYWSPYTEPRYRVPHIPLTRFLPVPVADLLFRAARPIAFALHARPLNAVRRKHGLPALGSDLRRVYTDADRTLYADAAELFPPIGMPVEHSYIGPVTWSPPIPVPDWWNELPQDKPVVYVTLGSSGQGQLLPLVLEALADLPVTVLAATAGNIDLATVPANARVARFLPGDLAARRAGLVVCNGGAPTCHQALLAGVPVLGIAANLDQFLNMDGITRSGAGILLRADRLTCFQVRAAAQALLADPAARNAAQDVARVFATYDAHARFLAVIDSLTVRNPHR